MSSQLPGNSILSRTRQGTNIKAFSIHAIGNKARLQATWLAKQLLAGILTPLSLQGVSKAWVFMDQGFLNRFKRQRRFPHHSLQLRRHLEPTALGHKHFSFFCISFNLTEGKSQWERFLIQNARPRVRTINRTNRGSLFGFTCAIQCFDDGDLFFYVGAERQNWTNTWGSFFFGVSPVKFIGLTVALSIRPKHQFNQNQLFFFGGLIKHSNACKQKMNHFHRAITYHFLTILILKSGVRPPRLVPGDIH